MMRPKTATAFAIERIKQLILEGELPPGARIDQVEIAERLGVSRLPVRQALTSLAGQNFVRLRDHRSAIVAPISEKDMRHLYTLRGQLERLAFEQGFSRFRQRHFKALDEILAAAEACVPTNDLTGFIQLNRDFHFSLYAIAENPYLVGCLKNLFDLSERYHRLYLRAPGMMAVSLAEHRELVDRIRDKDLAGFLAVCERHNGNTAEWVEEHDSIDEPGEATSEPT